MNWKQNLHLLAYIQLFVATLMAVPMMIAYARGEENAFAAFLLTIMIVWLISVVTLAYVHKNRNTKLGAKDGYLFVTLAWVIATAFGALPLWLSGAYDTYSGAYFEIMSGFTTTGATVLSEIESKPSSILFWRSATNWLGGMGIVVLFVALLPALGPGGTKLVGAESVGPTKDKLTPKIQNSAMILWMIYIGLSLVQTILLLFGGLTLYDAVTITFSTMAAAGFCVKNGSIGSFASPYVDTVVTVFMLIAGANFALYYKLLTRKFSQVWKDGEFKAYIGIWGITTFAAALSLFVNGTYPAFGTSFRYSAFQTASIMTTTGFATANYQIWPAFAQMVLFLLFFVGGCAGSAGGGIKVIRVVTMFKVAIAHIKQKIHPNGVFPIRVGKDTLRTDTVLSIAAFIGVYFATGLITSVILSLTNVDFTTSLSTAFLCLGNIGIGFGDVGPTGNFGFYPAWAKWLLSFVMLVGRLELFTVYALLTKSFWKR
jgi:trk system potassium uptake protein TrkH